MMFGKSILMALLMFFTVGVTLANYSNGKDVIKVDTKEELKNIIEQEIKKNGLETDLNHIDVSNITNMKRLFLRSRFNGDISKWDVSNVKDMRSMFYEADFNGDISNWDVSNVRDMSFMFQESDFNGDISKWDVSNVRDMRSMFADFRSNDDTSDWDVSNLASMFFGTGFNGDISKWDVSNVRDMRSMFRDSRFNGDISKWDVSNVRDMDSMFRKADFNGDISKWDVSSVTNMSGMFNDADFNGDISKWDVSNVRNMSHMFFKADFNGDISDWDVSDVETMEAMFFKSGYTNLGVLEWDTEYPMKYIVKGNEVLFKAYSEGSNRSNHISPRDLQKQNASLYKKLSSPREYIRPSKSYITKDFDDLIVLGTIYLVFFQIVCWRRIWDSENMYGTALILGSIHVIVTAIFVSWLLLTGFYSQIRDYELYGYSLIVAGPLIAGWTASAFESGNSGHYHARTGREFIYSDGSRVSEMEQRYDSSLDRGFRSKRSAFTMILFHLFGLTPFTMILLFVPVWSLGISNMLDTTIGATIIVLMTLLYLSIFRITKRRAY